MMKKMKIVNGLSSIIVDHNLNKNTVKMNKDLKKPGDLNRNKWSQKRGKIMKCLFSKTLL